MWSGPRNISTAMMRSFGARSDTWVADEPFYAAYLVGSGADHPMRSESIASQPNDWRDVIPGLLADPPHGRTVFYQKHMTHHMLPGFGLDWMKECANAFLIRDPDLVLASYSAKRVEVRLADLGFERQFEIFEREADRLGRPPPVIEGADVLRDPEGTLRKLCAALHIPWTAQMLGWPAGRRETDGVWAPAWYDAVEKSTSFSPPSVARETSLAGHLRHISDAARPHYEALKKHKLA